MLQAATSGSFTCFASLLTSCHVVHLYVQSMVQESKLTKSQSHKNNRNTLIRRVDVGAGISVTSLSQKSEHRDPTLLFPFPHLFPNKSPGPFFTSVLHSRHMMSTSLFIMFILLSLFITYWKCQPQFLLCVSWLDIKRHDSSESICPACVCILLTVFFFSLLTLTLTLAI